MAWKTNVDYPKPKAMLKAWAKEYQSSIRVMPLLHDTPFFVDLGNILLTILVVLAYYYSLRAFVWPRDGVEAEVVAVRATTTNKKKKEKKEVVVAEIEKSADAAAAVTPKKQETKKSVTPAKSKKNN
jgi:hypothetical protein